MIVSVNRIALTHMVILAAASMGVTTTAQGSIIIDSFSTTANDRFTNSASFVADGYDLSGVALNGRWAAMVSSNVFLSAYHYYPAIGSTLTFYDSNDPSGGSISRTVTEGQRIGTSDLWLGALDSPLPSGYTYYDFATEDIWSVPDFISSPYFGEEAFLFGRSPTSWPTSQDMAVGANVLDLWYDDVTTGVDAIGSVVNDSADAAYLTYEAFVQPGDSGGAMFIDDGVGNLKLIGINWFIGALTTGEDTNGQSYTGNYDAEILAYIAAHQIPEPSALLLLASACVAFACSRRQRHCR